MRDNVFCGDKSDNSSGFEGASEPFTP
uniref:Uncharacterized protein n=1 Tax=Arundo donax TaxID=35708 RepID=A0A0A9GML4_ARUDO